MRDMAEHDPGWQQDAETDESLAGQREVSAGLPVEELVDLQRAMGRIPAADRRLLMLAYVERKNCGEIAAQLGIAPDAARRRMSRAVQRFRHAMGPGYGREKR
jgi:DNA-directed RNA polymerase specialized sigma24 family protein